MLVVRRLGFQPEIRMIETAAGVCVLYSEGDLSELPYWSLSAVPTLVDFEHVQGKRLGGANG
jgi:hypothetical protein